MNITTIGIDALAEERYAFGSALELLRYDTVRDEAWPAFQRIFDTLEPDLHMNDGGTYRHRRFGRLRYYAQRGELTAEPHRPYYQPKYFNPLNGGIPRDFAPLDDAILGCAVFRRLLLRLGETYSRLEDATGWRINVYFNRILAHAGRAGKPVPEGMHRDGVKFSCLFMSQLVGCSGGETSLFDLITHEPVFKGRLQAPGDCLVFRDDTVLHDTTDIHAAQDDRPGFRDVLVIEFH